MFRSFLFSIKQIKETNAVFLVRSKAKELVDSLEQTKSGTYNLNEVKSSLEAQRCESTQNLRLTQKPIRALNTCSYKETKNNMNLQFKYSITNKPNLVHSYSESTNFKLALTIKNLRSFAVFESKLKEIESSVKQEIMDNENLVNFALNGISNSPFHSMHYDAL